MKHTILKFAAAVIPAFAIIGMHTMPGQETVQTVTTIAAAGTVSDFSPQAIVVRTPDSPEPGRYTYTKTTTYVDENGNPVSIETVRSGLPVIVYYEKDGDNLVVSKVVVRKAVNEPPPDTVEETKKTTTTTTTSTK